MITFNFFLISKILKIIPTLFNFFLFTLKQTSAFEKWYFKAHSGSVKLKANLKEFFKMDDYDNILI